MEKVTKKEPQERPRSSSPKKKEIDKFLESNRKKIESEELLVFFLDECHLIWRDICGYVWGKTDMRIEIPIKNEKEITIVRFCTSKIPRNKIFPECKHLVLKYYY